MTKFDLTLMNIYLLLSFNRRNLFPNMHFIHNQNLKTEYFFDDYFMMTFLITLNLTEVKHASFKL